jgi:carbamoylphosphate synthase small subunit
LQWLKSEKVPGLYGIDTRALTKKLRDSGSMKGKIITEGVADIPFEDPNLENLVRRQLHHHHIYLYLCTEYRLL